MSPLPAGDSGNERAQRFSRLRSLFRKEMLETFRDWKMLSMTLTFAPFFVLLMYAYLGHTTPVYPVAVVNEDMGGRPVAGADDVNLGGESGGGSGAVRSPEGETILRVRVTEEAEVETLLENRRVDVALFIPPDFSEAILAVRRGGGALHRCRSGAGGTRPIPDYLMAAVWADMTIMGFVEYASGLQVPALLSPETVTGAISLTDFELFVPGLLILALMMLMFTAAGALIREKDKGTLIRLRLSNLTVFEWLSAVSATQLIVGTLALALTFLTAMAVGYRANGSLGLLFLVGGLTSLSIMAFSVLVAAFLRTRLRSGHRGVLPLLHPHVLLRRDVPPSRGAPLPMG